MNTAKRHIRTQERTGYKAELLRLDATEVLVVAAVIMALVYAISIAVARPGTPADVPTTTIRVSQSQTLWSLASEYRVAGLSTAQTAELIKSLNRMDDSSLQAGARILVPCTIEVAAAVVSR